jgi:hypothetical protein
MFHIQHSHLTLGEKVPVDVSQGSQAFAWQVL